jgi:hypothetical protein
MELPDDVLRLIRDYAKPCFKYFREYNHMLRLCGVQEWSALRKALQLTPEKVLPYIHTHEKAQTAWFHIYLQILDLRERLDLDP